MRSSRPDNAGYTALEVIIATLITVVVVGAATRSILGLQDSLIDASVRSTTLDSARRLVDRLVAELRDAQRESLILTPAVDAQVITFARVTGWDGSEPIVGPDHTISFDTGTVLFDGIPIAALIDDLRFNLDGSVLTIFVRVERTLHVFGAPETITRELSVELNLLDP